SIVCGGSHDHHAAALSTGETASLTCALRRQRPCADGSVRLDQPGSAISWWVWRARGYARTACGERVPGALRTLRCTDIELGTGCRFLLVLVLGAPWRWTDARKSVRVVRPFNARVGSCRSVPCVRTLAIAAVLVLHLARPFRLQARIRIIRNNVKVE
ncbi:hypothetical protein CERSUDRAFT_122154, partial [Gelatoporia subvermispora B]